MVSYYLACAPDWLRGKKHDVTLKCTIWWMLSWRIDNLDMRSETGCANTPSLAIPAHPNAHHPSPLPPS